MFIVSILYGAITWCYFSGIWIKGLYSNLIISIGFLGMVAFYFVSVSNTRLKIVAIPLLSGLVVLSLITITFNDKTFQTEINHDYDLIVASRGILSCGETIYFTESRLLFFEVEKLQKSNICLTGIYKIETIRFDDNFAEFEIYHDGILDSENPYNWKIENKNVW